MLNSDWLSFIALNTIILCGNSSVGRASASQAEGREFEPRLPLNCNHHFVFFRTKVVIPFCRRTIVGLKYNVQAPAAFTLILEVINNHVTNHYPYSSN